MIRPILFNTDMVKSILDGIKTVTRRCVKAKSKNACGFYVTFRKSDNAFMGVYDYDENEMQYDNQQTQPAYPGDILWVRETWRVGAWDIQNQMIAFDYKDGTCGELTYIHDRELLERLVNQSREDAQKAGCKYNGADFIWKKGKSPCRWHPSIHMSKEAARIWLKVTDVRVERLQDISGMDVLKEGVNSHVHPEADYFDVNQREMFQSLWNSTIDKKQIDTYGWEANPWVWVIEFERCEKPEGWCV